MQVKLVCYGAFEFDVCKGSHMYLEAYSIERKLGIVYIYMEICKEPGL